MGAQDLKTFPLVPVRLILRIILLCQFIQFCNGDGIEDEAMHAHELRLRNSLGLLLEGGSVTHNYSHILPPHNKTSPINVKIGLSPILIKQLDTRKQILEMEAWLKLSWFDTRFRWKKENYGGLTIMRLPDHHIWQPDIKLYNGALAATVDEKSDVYCLLHNTGEVVWIPPTTFHTICEVDLRHYPYDRHSCSIKMGSWTLDGYHLNLTLYSTEKQSALDLIDLHNTAGEWKVLGGTEERHVAVYPCCDQPYVSVLFRLELQRRSPLYAMTILCPIIAAIILTLASFWLPPSAYEKITMNIVSLVILVFILMHFANIIPPVGSKSPIIVVFCGNITILVATWTAVSVFFLSLLRTLQNQPVLRYVNVALHSRLATVFFVSIPVNFEQFTNIEDMTKLEPHPDTEDPHRQQSGDMIQAGRIQWVCFFQLLDRIAFAIFILVIIVVLIVTFV